VLQQRIIFANVDRNAPQHPLESYESITETEAAAVDAKFADR
jgi:hypothetical protein